MLRRPPDILITTPESLFLLLTSRARAILAGVDTVIVDEIHAMVGTKRGAHLALSLERLAEVTRRPPQRIGLSATQRPLEEVARFLGGGDGLRTWRPRPVTIVDAGAKKAFDLRVEVPVEDMSRLGETIEPSPDVIPEGPASALARRSIWPAIHPRLLALVRAHRSTIVFVNSRRLAERLAAALNELAGEDVARAHHGSIAREQRIEMEDALKSGRLPAIVATSSLELGIDMGAVDLVVQIETPTSVASGMQRIGRASHQVDAVSRGVIFPKYRGDLLASAAITKAMKEGAVEETRVPRNPLDVLAQHLVAAVALGERRVDDLFALVRGAAPYAHLSRATFEGTLDMLAGRYPSDEFAELRPRVVWDRLRGTVRPREGAQRLVVANAGTIPDRGLYGVFLADGEGGGRRVGELDEEMVFESRVGEVFVLGASSWRIAEITRDRVLVVPAPGEPGKMPFWKADRGARPVELGRRIGRLTREIGHAPRDEAVRRLREEHDLDPLAAQNLVAYLEEQKESDRCPARRPHARPRAHARRDGRLAALPPLAVGRARPRAVGDGPRGAAAQERRGRGRDRVDGRRHRRPPARARPAARGRGPPARAGGDRGPRDRRAQRLEPLRRALPRGRRPRSPPPAAAPRAEDASLDAEEARARPAAGRLAPPVLPDRARGLPRVPAGRLRPARARRARAARAAARDPPRDRRHPGAVALLGVAPLRLRRELPLRGRRAARRAPSAGAVRRPVAAA